jgi:hypothetical protein
MSLKHPGHALAVMTSQGLGPQGSETAEKSVLTGNISGSLVIPKHTLKLGDIIRIRLGGTNKAIYDNAVNITLRFRVGGAVIALTWMQGGFIFTTDLWWYTAEIIVAAGSPLASVVSDGHMFWPGNPFPSFALPQVSGTIDPAIQNGIDVTFQWDAAVNLTERFVNADTAVVEYLSPGP